MHSLTRECDLTFCILLLEEVMELSLSSSTLLPLYLSLYKHGVFVVDMRNRIKNNLLISPMLNERDNNTCTKKKLNWLMTNIILFRLHCSIYKETTEREPKS